jgi:hypothetical protein
MEVHMIRKVRIAFALTSLAVLTAATVVTASAGGRNVFTATMTGLTTPGTFVAGLQGAGAAWMIDEGFATLKADGRLHVEVEGLVLLNGTNPIDTGRAAVSCGGVVVATTDPVDFSDAGDAEVSAVVSLPSECIAPTVFFTNPAGTRWFAVTGF